LVRAQEEEQKLYRDVGLFYWLLPSLTSFEKHLKALHDFHFKHLKEHFKSTKN